MTAPWCVAAPGRYVPLESMIEGEGARVPVVLYTHSRVQLGHLGIGDRARRDASRMYTWQAAGKLGCAAHEAVFR